MANGQRINRPRAGNRFMGNYGHGNRFRMSSYPPRSNNNNDRFLPSNFFSPHEYPQSSEPLYIERAYLLSSLHEEDSRTTSLLVAIAEINAHMASGAPIRPKDARALRRKLGAKNNSAEISMQQERRILQRLGEVTFMIQQKERWEMVEREKNIGVSTAVGTRIGMAYYYPWGGWNGAWIGDKWGWQGQTAPFRYAETQEQNYLGGQEWSHQVSAPGYMVDVQSASEKDGGFTDYTSRQPVALIDGPCGWEIPQASGTNETRQRSPWSTKSESPFKTMSSRRGAWNRLSAPSLGSGPWGSGSPRYLGYFLA